MRLLFPLAAVLGLAVSAGAAPPRPFLLEDGDRVVLLGNTLIEREQRYGYWEAALVSRFPDRNVTFRNLGWSGDTVWGEARAGFGSAEDGFRRLQEQVRAARPTVLLIAYGGNEAFAGPAGLPHFRQGLDRLLDALAPTKARVVLLAPLPHEDVGRPLPDPAKYNRDLRLYREVLEQAAQRRDYRFVDLCEQRDPRRRGTRLTDNGMHLTAYGYWQTAFELVLGLDLMPQRWRVWVDLDGDSIFEDGTKLSDVKRHPLRFQAGDTWLPRCLPPAGSGREPELKVTSLAPGRYVLRIDGKPVMTATAKEWAGGVVLRRGPALDQSEKLRAAIIAKNELYFHRWRPENETYLFGFRKHEQGQNAREVPQFDPLVEKADKEIARLRVPAAHRYEILPEK